MKSRFTTIAIFLLLSVAFSHVTFAQDDGFKPLCKSVTIEKQTIAPVKVPAEAFTIFESQTNQTSLIGNQYAEVVQPVFNQECIADADYGSCRENKSFCTYNELSSSILKLHRFTFLAIKPITHSSGGMPFIRA
jgi:hypothetical protein